MRRIVILIALACLMLGPVEAVELTAPVVPDSGAELMPARTENFGQAVMQILSDAIGHFRPDLKEAAVSCVSVLAGAMVLALAGSFSGRQKAPVELTGALVAAGLLFRSAHSLIALGAGTVEELSEYGKLLLPVMTAGLAAQGGVTAATALYAGTAAFDAVLSGLISRILIPMIYLYLALAAGCCAMDDAMLKKLRDGMKWAVGWCLKSVLYVYTGYISITGVISGTTDAGILKATKLTISGAVPVVGGIMSDASEAVLISAGTVKNAAGIYGMLAILAVWIGPFLRIWAHYLILKALELICGVFGVRSVTQVAADFSSAMGLVLAMTGAVCLMLIISTICFMKGVGL